LNAVNAEIMEGRNDRLQGHNRFSMSIAWRARRLLNVVDITALRSARSLIRQHRLS
jgi:hypothetical protein